MDYVTYKNERYEIDEYGRLYLSDLDIQDISDIVGLEKLRGVKSLSLQNNKISEIKGLDNIVDLETLYLYYNEITEIKNLEGLTNLKKLVLNDNRIIQIKGLENLTNLIELKLTDNQIKRIENLQSLVKLEHLDLHGNDINEIKGLETLENLRTLYLSGNEIIQIKGIDTLSKLKKLYLNNNNIKEIKGLENLENLLYIRIDENPIPESLIQEIGGEGYGTAQKFVDYCRRKIEIESTQEEEKISKELEFDEKQKEKAKIRIAKSYTRLSQLDKDWEDFLKEDTYLTYDIKLKFKDQIKSLSKFPLFYRLIHPSRIKKFNLKIEDLRGTIDNYNEKFTKKRLEEYSDFFEGKEFGIKYPLDSDQRIAVVKNDMHNLVIAGAGSGKTSVITNRIAYLVKRKDNIDKSKILALAFTNVAAKEMRERLLKTYKIDIDISTFHALGSKIIQDETNSRPRLITDGSLNREYELIKELFTDLLKDKVYQNLLFDYLSYHSEEEIEEENFEEKELYLKYMKNKDYTTLDNIPVKSLSERDIGNFLFRHNISYQYEPLAEWVDESSEGKEYHPDFYLPEHDIYIEHWGLNRDLEVPDWFTITSEEYRATREWKFSQFKNHEKILVETWEYERQEGTLISNLKKRLVRIIPEIKFIHMNYEDLVKKTHDFEVKRKDILNLISNFIQIAKSNFLMEPDIERRLRLKEYNKKQKSFGRLALEVYKKYQKLLRSEKKIDFNDMINLAVELIKRNPEQYLNRYDHILIDEFQDISYQRMELINCFVNDKSNTRLFCVGDDWQSIYQFTGSDVRYIVNFNHYFPYPENSHLTRNYRSAQNIVNLSNNVISNNKNQINKEAYSKANLVDKTIVYFEFSQRIEDSTKISPPRIYHLIKKLLEEGAKPEEIMVISRFNLKLRKAEIFCGANDIPIEEYSPRGKTKGVHFYSAHKSKGSESKYVILTDLTSGTYGFPCEVQDSSVFAVAKRFVAKSFIEEERRLFYVALTRSKQFLFLFSVQENQSMFIDEILPFIRKITVPSEGVWDKIISEYVPQVLKGFDRTSGAKIFCKECGGILIEREGKRGAFLGCSNYPQCNYTFNPPKNDSEKCPKCGNRLVERQGRLGKFIGCTGYPRCKYTLDIEIEDEKSIICPDCNGRLLVKTGKYGKFVSCINYPQCRFAFNLKKNARSRIGCPKCGSPLAVREGKYGQFLGCIGYPKCKFVFNI
jgi:DNA helicase-4